MSDFSAPQPKDQVCDFCGSPQRKFLFSGPDRHLGNPGEFSLYECGKCGLIYQYPQMPWAELEKYYQGDYDSYGKLLRQEPSAIKRAIKRVGSLKQRSYIEKFCKSGNLLDIGCGNGVFLEEMALAGGWQLRGVEPNRSAAVFAQQQLNIPIDTAPFEQAAVPDASQDVLTMWNVFEHLAEPQAALRKAYAMLKPGGHLIFAVPNPECLSRRVFGPYWMGWELPRHLFLFPRQPLVRMLGEIGFEVVDRSCFMVSYFVLGNSLTFWMQSWPKALHPLANGLRRLYYTPITRLVVFPFQTVVEKAKQATVLTWAVRKPLREREDARSKKQEALSGDMPHQGGI